MEITQSMNGLKAAYASIDNISRNIVNSTTNGFKSGQVLYNEVRSNSNMSSLNNGLGVKISKIVQNFTNGSKIYTDNPMDVSINDNGFFGIKDIGGNFYLTRNGHFKIDSEYNLVNDQKMYVLGYPKNLLETNSNLFNPINIKNFRVLPNKPTQSIQILSTFNVNDHIKPPNQFNPINKNTYNKNTTMLVYDAFGKPKKLNIFFLKKSDFIWKIYITDSNYKDIQPLSLEFNHNGKIISKYIKTIRMKNKNSFDNIIALNLGNITQKNVDHTTIKQINQDGYNTGKISNVIIDDHGVVIGKYSNNKIKKLCQITLFDVLAKENLELNKENNWALTQSAKIHTIGIPGDNYFKKLTTKSLEHSNVRLEQELVNIIKAQKNYQSNAQFLKIQDSMLNTLINLK